MELNEGQQIALKLIEDRNNVFLTGQAGVGKSELIKKIIEIYIGRGKTVGVTALTGIAAVNIKGVTLHRWAGIGLGTGTPADLLKKVRRKPKAKSNWLNSSLLIIDEISMMSPDLFVKIEFIARGIRKINAPFGGLQLLFCGDFCQLGPVSIDAFCFESPVWKSCCFRVAHLTENMRQNDPSFQRILGQIRMGHVSQEARELLNARVGAKVGTDEIKPTVLYPNRASADELNNKRLKAIPSENNPVHEFSSGDFITGNTKALDPDVEKDYYGLLDKSCQAKKTLRLKVGAQVMLIHNLDIECGLVNGSRGVVKSFHHISETETRPIVKFLNGMEILISHVTWDVDIADDIVVSRSQLPLILAFGATIHKCQGMTLDCVEVSLGDSIFTAGQFYTALSRVRSLGGLSIIDLNFDKVLCDPKARAFYEALE